MRCQRKECVAARRVVDAVVAEQRAAQETYGARGMAVGAAHERWMSAWAARIAAVNEWLKAGNGKLEVMEP